VKICNDSNPCTKDACDKLSGACTFDTLKLGDACDDGSACSVDDACDLAGQCKGKTKVCDDNSPCTDDACNAVTGQCETKNLIKICDDGDACTISDVCIDGACSAGAGAISTLAGSGVASFLDGAAASARFSSPEDVAVDAAGNVFVADTYNHRIRKITASGQVSTLAGKGSASFLDGPGASAYFYYPSGIAVDNKGNVYVADRTNQRIRLVTADGTTSTLAGNATAGYLDGKGVSARFNNPQGIDYGSDGNLYVADTNNHRIRRIDAFGVVTSVAGSSAGLLEGPAGLARFNTPFDVRFGVKGDLFVADYGNHRIRRVGPDGIVSTLAGSTPGTTDGLGEKAQFSSPSGIALDPYGHLIVVTRSGHRLRRVTQSGAVSTLAGSIAGFVDGAPQDAKFNTPSGIALAPDGSVLIADRGNHRIRKMASTKTSCSDDLPCTTDSCDKISGKCDFKQIASGGKCEDGDGCTVGEVCDGKGGCAGGAKKNCDDKNACSLDACNPFSGECVFTPAIGLCSDGQFCTVNDRCEGGQCVGNARETSTLAGDSAGGFIDGKGTTARFNAPRGLTVDSQGRVWVADSSNHSIRRVSAKGVVETIAGSNTQATFLDGKGTNARFSSPADVTLDGQGGVFVADRNNHRIRRVSASGTVSTFAGNGSATYKDGTGTGAGFYYPEGIGRGGSGTIYVADTYNHRIRAISQDGVVTLVAGSGGATWKDGLKTAASFNYPRGIAVDSKQNVWVADSNNHRIRRIDPQGNVITVAGSGSGTWKDDKGALASFSSPYGIAIGPDDLAWVADRSNHRIRGVTADGVVTTLSGSTGGFKDDVMVDALFNAPQGIHIDSKYNVYIAEAGNRIRKMATPFNDCDDGTECTTNSCDEAKDACDAKPVGDGQNCVDGKPCLANRVCNQGFCVGGVPKDCNDKNSCTLDKCDALSGDCYYTADQQVGCSVSRRVFITDGVWTGVLGGLAGAHAKCKSAADNAGLGGDWYAWLSDSSTQPSQFFDKATVPYRRLDGGLIALNWNDLVDGTLDSTIDISETGAKVVSKSTSYCGSGYVPAVWTNTNEAGNRAAPNTSTLYNCANWATNTTSTSYKGGAGIASATTKQWTVGCATQSCNYSAHLYCFEQVDHWSKN
jgi:sugar lactone lactonase YvrE